MFEVKDPDGDSFNVEAPCMRDARCTGTARQQVGRPPQLGRTWAKRRDAPGAHQLNVPNWIIYGGTDER